MEIDREKKMDPERGGRGRDQRGGSLCLMNLSAHSLLPFRLLFLLLNTFLLFVFSSSPSFFLFVSLSLCFLYVHEHSHAGKD